MTARRSLPRRCACRSVARSCGEDTFTLEIDQRRVVIAGGVRSSSMTPPARRTRQARRKTPRSMTNATANERSSQPSSRSPRPMNTSHTITLQSYIESGQARCPDMVLVNVIDLTSRKSISTDVRWPTPVPSSMATAVPAGHRWPAPVSTGSQPSSPPTSAAASHSPTRSGSPRRPAAARQKARTPSSTGRYPRTPSAYGRPSHIVLDQVQGYHHIINITDNRDLQRLAGLSLR